MDVFILFLACISCTFTFIDSLDETSARLQHLEDIVLDLADKNARLEQRINALETENEILRTESCIENIRGNNVLKRQLLSSTVAFTAILTGHDVSNLQNGDVVIFDTIITNVADAYDSNTGVFTAPVGGVYVFNYALMVEPGTQEYLQIVRDGQHIINNFAHSTGLNVYSSSSRTVTLGLQQGSKVWIQTPPDFDHGDGTIHGNEYTTFSGWLISFNE